MPNTSVPGELPGFPSLQGALDAYPVSDSPTDARGSRRHDGPDHFITPLCFGPIRDVSECRSDARRPAFVSGALDVHDHLVVEHAARPALAALAVPERGRSRPDGVVRRSGGAAEALHAASGHELEPGVVDA